MRLMTPSRSTKTTTGFSSAIDRSDVTRPLSSRLAPIEQGTSNTRLNVLGVGISLINMGLALDRLNRWIQGHERQYVSVCNVHSLMESRRDDKLRRIVNAAGMTTPDGMPLVWLSRMAGHRYVSRVYGPDLMLAEMAASVPAGHSHFFFGGRDGVADHLAESIRRRFPGVRIAGTMTPALGTAAELCNAETASR